jgi:hypothetical protein
MLLEIWVQLILRRPCFYLKRRLSLHDSISLFQTNDVVRKSPIEAGQAEQETAAKKESLMNSAWRERAYERLADIPVGISLVNEMIPG